MLKDDGTKKRRFIAFEELLRKIRYSVQYFGGRRSEIVFRAYN